MKTALIILALLTTVLSGQTQSDSTVAVNDNPSIPRNTAYAELLGAGLLYSANYERLLTETKSVGLYGRIGYSYYPVLKKSEVMQDESDPHMFPVGLTLVYKRKDQQKRLYFEQGLYFPWLLRDVRRKQGRTFINSGLLGAVHLAGLRWQPKEQKNGFYCRVVGGAIVWLYEVYYNDVYVMNQSPELWRTYIPLIGFSFGYTFSINKIEVDEK